MKPSPSSQPAPVVAARAAASVHPSPRRSIPFLVVFALALSALGCATSRPPLPTAARVDLERYMGAWFVIAHIPAGAEKNAYDAVETYVLARDGSIGTTYVFREGGHDGPERRLTPRGFVRDRTTNATWGMQFVWPLRLEYLVAHVDENYSETIVARTARDYVWIMARRPDVSEADYARLVGRVGALGYDVTRLRRVPHRGVPASEP